MAADQVFEIIFQTTSSDAVAGANEVSKSLEGVTKSSEEARHGAKSLREGVEGVKIAEFALAAALRGDYVEAAAAATKATRVLTTAFTANPLGIAITVIASAITLWLSYRQNVKSAADAHKELGDESKKLHDALDEGGKKIKADSDAVEELANNLKRAADEAARFRKAEDDLASAQLASDLAKTNLAESQGKLSPDQARERRSGLRLSARNAELDRAEAEAQENAREAAFALGEKDLAAKDAAKQRDEAKHAFDDAVSRARDAQANIDLAPGGLEAASKAAREKAAAIRVQPDAATPEGAARQRGAAEAADNQAEALDRLIDAQARLKQTSDAAKKAEDDLAESYKKTEAGLEDATATIKKAEVERRTASTTLATDEQKVANEREAERTKVALDRRNRSEDERIALIDAARAKAKHDATIKPPKTEVDKEAQRRRDEQAEIDAQGRTAAGGLSKLGSSPELRNRLASVAKSLSDGVKPGETEAVMALLEHIVSAQERSHKDTKAASDKLAEIRALDARVKRLEADRGKSG